jgi:hypothetical protein
MRCIWRKRMKNCERTVIVLKDIMFKSLYVWMTAHNNSHFSNFLEFLLFVFFYLVWCFSCILHLFLGCAPLSF